MAKFHTHLYEYKLNTLNTEEKIGPILLLYETPGDYQTVYLRYVTVTSISPQTNKKHKKKNTSV
jgi:hypothetical protein